MRMNAECSPEDFFDGSAGGFDIYLAIRAAIDTLGPTTQKISKSQIAFWRRHGFAYVWRPGQYVKSDVPAVLSIALRRRLSSSRFKQVINPSGNIWMHHIELTRPEQVDVEVLRWLGEAYQDAGPVN